MTRSAHKLVRVSMALAIGGFFAAGCKSKSDERRETFGATTLVSWTEQGILEHAYKVTRLVGPDGVLIRKLNYFSPNPQHTRAIAQDLDCAPSKSCGIDRALVLVDLVDGRVIARRPLASGAGWGSGPWVALRSADGPAIVFLREDGSESRWPHPGESLVWDGTSWSPDGTTFAVATLVDEGRVRNGTALSTRWYLRSGRPGTTPRIVESWSSEKPMSCLFRIAWEGRTPSLVCNDFDCRECTAARVPASP